MQERRNRGIESDQEDHQKDESEEQEREERMSVSSCNEEQSGNESDQRYHDSNEENQLRPRSPIKSNKETQSERWVISPRVVCRSQRATKGINPLRFREI